MKRVDHARSSTAITGGGRGIGRAIALRLAAQGHRVTLGYVHDAASADAVVAEITAAGGAARARPVDVTDPVSLDRFLDDAADGAPLTGVVANAGAVRAVGPLAQLDPEDIRRDLEVNLTGAVLTCRAAIPHLEASRGAIVTISSAAATLGSPGTYVHYAAAKAGVEALTVGLAKELAPLGIRVNAVAPGTVHSDFHLDRDRPAKVAPSIPLGRAGEPHEIAGAVAWLLSDDASYATGAVLRVAGGL